jgi:aspartyl-tRNA(Asn)/glutamyl-tRNA(Gln) amidotransferase subunit A
MNYTRAVNFPAWMADAPAAELASLSLVEAAERLRSKRVSSVELTQACLDRIAALDDTLHAFITVMAKTALTQAREADDELARGNYRGPLHGIPIALKDLIDVAGVRTTAASRLFANRVATKNAPVIDQLLQAGAVIVGKTNLHEFAYGGSGVISAFGITHNPHNPAHITGGSSSGSAAAVAAGMCFAAIGTDTAGSIRLPSAYCGVLGLKPTYELVSAEGVVPLAETYDHVGPIARSGADTEAFMRVLAPSLAEPSDEELRLGIARKYFFDDLAPEISDIVEAAIARLASHAASVTDIDVPVEEDRTAQMFESYRYHRSYVETTPELYDPRTRARVLRGRDVTAEQYAAALAQTHHLRASVEKLFEHVNVIVTPTVPIAPPTIAELESNADTLRAREILMLRNTRPFNVLGLPTLSVPCGWTRAGLPVGLQITTARGNDLGALRIANKITDEE